MKFRFYVNINDSDYFEYNCFWMMRSPYGKKQMVMLRLTIAALFLLFIIISLFSGAFSGEAMVYAGSLAVLSVLIQIFFNKFLYSSLKGQIKSLKKSGKMGYAAESVIEFFEDRFTETTPENKIEHSYSVLERVSIVDGRYVYIHINNVMSYILPVSCFESKEHYEAFLDFIKEKCSVIDVY